MLRENFSHTVLHVYVKAQFVLCLLCFTTPLCQVLAWAVHVSLADADALLGSQCSPHNTFDRATAKLLELTSRFSDPRPSVSDFAQDLGWFERRQPPCEELLTSLNFLSTFSTNETSAEPPRTVLSSFVYCATSVKVAAM